MGTICSQFTLSLSNISPPQYSRNPLVAAASTFMELPDGLESQALASAVKVAVNQVLFLEIQNLPDLLNHL